MTRPSSGFGFDFLIIVFTFVVSMRTRARFSFLAPITPYVNPQQGVSNVPSIVTN